MILHNKRPSISLHKPPRRQKKVSRRQKILRISLSVSKAKAPALSSLMRARGRLFWRRIELAHKFNKLPRQWQVLRQPHQIRNKTIQPDSLQLTILATSTKLTSLRKKTLCRLRSLLLQRAPPSAAVLTEQLQKRQGKAYRASRSMRRLVEPLRQAIVTRLCERSLSEINRALTSRHKSVDSKASTIPTSICLN